MNTRLAMRATRFVTLSILCFIALMGAGVPTAGAATIATAERGSCGVFADGVRCWGASDVVGFNNPESATTYATKVGVALSGVTDLDGASTGGGGGRFCAVASGAAWCWGTNTGYAMGLGVTTGTVQVPTAVPSLGSGVTMVDLATSRSCWIVNGGARCAGGAYLGDDTNDDSSVPVGVVGHGASGATEIGAGWRSTCVLSAGVVGCWGAGTHGQLGGGAGSDMVDGTVPLPGAATDLDAGTDSACAVVGGGVYCWGSSSNGRLGRGDNTTGKDPAPVSGLGIGSGVVDVSGNASTYCALRSNGDVLCWGQNWNGQVGNGTTQNDVPTPAKVVLPGAASAVSTSNGHSCAAVGADFYCWGNNGYGQLGGGTSGGQSGSPVKVLLPPGATTTKPKATIAGKSQPVRIPRTRRVNIGTVRCPAGAGVCRLTMPQFVNVRFARKTYRLSVPRVAPVRAGKTAHIAVIVPPALRDALGSRSVRVNVRIVAKNLGGSVARVAGATIKR